MVWRWKAGVKDAGVYVLRVQSGCIVDRMLTDSVTPKPPQASDRVAVVGWGWGMGGLQ